MRILLDTNALLWQLKDADGGLLGKQAVAMMEQADEVCVSSISVVEAQIKTMLNRLKMPLNSTSAITDAGNTVLAFEPRMGDAVRKFPELTRHDPFDRMILAHAMVEGLTLLTSDRTLLSLGLNYVVNSKK